MSEVTTEIAEIKQVVSAIEKIKTYLPKMQEGNTLAMSIAEEIKLAKITSPEQREAQVAKIQTIKKIYDKINAMRVQVTDPIDAAKNWIMGFEREFNYSAKTDNEYNKAKAVIVAYDQQVINDNKDAEILAEKNRQIALYKADLKEKVAKQLVAMMAGKHKNHIQKMADWEASLTVGTIDQAVESLKAAKPALKQEFYDECFKTEFSGKKTLITDEELLVWMEEFKKEMPFSKYAEEYIQMAAPLINEYRSKMPAVKAKLEAIEKESAEKKKELEDKRVADLEAKAQEAVKEVNAVTEVKIEHIEQVKENAVMDADFTKQAQLQDQESAPVKYQASFASAAWVQPFMTLVGHCIKSEKFNMYKAKGGYIDSIEWWLNFFSTNCPQTEVPGIEWKEVPKTIIKGK